MTMNNCKCEQIKLDINKDTNTLINESYDYYKALSSEEDIYFNNKIILFKNEIDVHTMKELGFEHIISMKNNIGLRIYEKNRMIYLPMIKIIFCDCLTNKSEDITIYRDRKDICIWCKKLNYLIVLTERENGYLLQTAYPIIYKNKLREVEKKANENGIY